jgi:hypothetical protein
MKRSELKQIIKEEVKKAISESPDDPASNLLSLISTSDISKYMDKLSDTINDNDFKVIKDLYNKLYAELKKHEG